MTGERVLIVEDDERVAAGLRRALEGHHYVVDRAGSVAHATELSTLQAPDIVLLDLGLPDGDGLDLCRSLRQSQPALPIIMLTARASEIDVVVGLQSGAVDYVTKPFRLAELLARVQTHLRTATIAPTQSVFTQGDLVIDQHARRVWLADNEIEMRAKELDLLIMLAQHAGRALTREHLMRDVWDEHWYGSTKTLDVHIASLRRRLDADHGPSRITTLRGVGYRFETR